MVLTKEELDELRAIARKYAEQARPADEDAAQVFARLVFQASMKKRNLKHLYA